MKKEDEGQAHFNGPAKGVFVTKEEAERILNEIHGSPKPCLTSGDEEKK